ncbi:hypothetical protein ES707_16511 [subsurface metagenome]
MERLPFVDIFRCNFVFSKKAHRIFKQYLKENSTLNISEALRASAFFIMGLKGDDLAKFFIMGQEQEMAFYKARDAEREKFFTRVTGMQDRIQKAIEQKLLHESFKKEIVKPGGLKKIEAAFEIIEDLDKKVISAKEAKKALAGV